MALPNFLILGAAKSGTTALYFQLKQHPDVYLSPVKEPHFFSYMGQGLDMPGPGDYIPGRAIRDLASYQALFDGVTTESVIGEASPTYLYVPGTAERIRAHVPQARLVAILRHPAERAFSAYMHVRRDGREPAGTFAAALRLEDQRIAENWEPIWHYQASGYYCRQLQRYYDCFDRQQIRVYLYERFQADPAGVLADLCRFLGVRDDFPFRMDVRPNVSGVLRSQRADRLMNRLFQRNNPLKTLARRILPEQTRLRFTEAVRNRNLARPALSSVDRERLVSVFREDILCLQDLIQQDLTSWLS